MKPSEIRILVIEDNPEWVFKTRQILRQAGYENVETAADADEARRKFAEFRPHLAVVDIMLPDESAGFDLIREMREQSGQMHIIAVSALESSDYKSFGIRAGADDYIAKTATITELSDRLVHHLKRIPGDMQGSVVEWRNVSLDIDLGVVTCEKRGGKNATFLLSGYEMRILGFLMRRQGEAFTAQELHDTFWGKDEARSTNVASQRIKAIRDKFIAAGVACPITTRSGGGYAVERE